MYHIGIGISSTVYAGTARKLKDGNEAWIRKDDVTKEFLGVMVEYLIDNHNTVCISVNGKPKYKITLEEIKEKLMTDEELAEEYCNNEVPFDITESGEKLYTENDLKYAYLAGLKASKPKWHNLRENRNDLPPLWEGCERASIRVVDEYDRIISYDYGSERWRDCEGDLLGVQPDFWCEIPMYK